MTRTSQGTDFICDFANSQISYFQFSSITTVTLKRLPQLEAMTLSNPNISPCTMYINIYTKFRLEYTFLKTLYQHLYHRISNATRSFIYVVDVHIIMFTHTHISISNAMSKQVSLPLLIINVLKVRRFLCGYQHTICTFLISSSS